MSHSKSSGERRLAICTEIISSINQVCPIREANAKASTAVWWVIRQNTPVNSVWRTNLTLIPRAAVAFTTLILDDNIPLLLKLNSQQWQFVGQHQRSESYCG